MRGMTRDETLAFNRTVIDEFRANGGVMPEGSIFHGNPTLLLTMTGARSGRRLTSPLTYSKDGDTFIVMASAGGSETAPAWAFNLRANADVELEVGEERFTARATETEGEDRERAYEIMTGNLPRFADYQAGVERTIPLFRLERTG